MGFAALNPSYNHPTRLDLQTAWWSYLEATVARIERSEIRGLSLAARTRISGGFAGKHRGPAPGRAGQLSHRLVSPGRHAAHDGGISTAGIHHHAGCHLYPDR